MASSLTTRFKELRLDEIEDVPLHDDDGAHNDKSHETLCDTNALCDVCISKCDRTRALYLCYKCKVYLCLKCFCIHEDGHSFVKVLSDTTARKAKANCFVGIMRGEKMREDRLDQNDITVSGQINVKHELDNDHCDITGMCGLDSNRWVVLDSQNSCLKIFHSFSYRLQRYIRFGSKLWDVSEILVTQNSADSNSDCRSKGKETKQSLLAVTLPYIKQIWIIDANTNPAVKSKVIPMEYNCLRVDFHDLKLFVLCREDAGSPGFYSVHILSLDGNSLKVIHTDLYDYVPDFVVSSGRIYLTDEYNDRLVCLDSKDEEKLSEVIIKGSKPVGISVDTRDNIFVCSPRHDAVYRLDPWLKSYNALSMKTRLFENPWKLCIYKDRMYVSYNWSSKSLGNTVTVVQLS